MLKGMTLAKKKTKDNAGVISTAHSPAYTSPTYNPIKYCDGYRDARLFEKRNCGG